MLAKREISMESGWAVAPADWWLRGVSDAGADLPNALHYQDGPIRTVAIGLSQKDCLKRTFLTVKDMRNPFQYGAELKPGQIVNRKQELRDVQRAILEHGRLFLLGPRRFGKTAILRAATAAAERDGAIVIRLDAEAYPGVDGLVRAIVTESA